MPRKRKNKALSAYPRKYLPSGRDSADEREKFRELFLYQVALTTPEVVTDLARAVLPAYGETFWPEAKRRGAASVWLDNGGKYHREMARAWFHRDTGSKWWNRYGTARDELLAWAKRYRLEAEWLLHAALDALVNWARDRVPDDDKLTAALEREEPRSIATSGYPWPFLPPWSSWRDSPKRCFEYPVWDGHDERHYQKIVTEEFEKHLTKYLHEIQAEVPLRKRVRLVTKPERFKMLALYLCRRQTLDQIAENENLKSRKDPTGVSRDIREAAKLIDLPLPSQRR